MRHGLRPTTAEDRTAEIAVYRSTREPELQLTDWPQAQQQAFVLMQFEAQQAHYRRLWPNSTCELIEQSDSSAGTGTGTGVGVGVQVVGRLWVDRRSDELHVLDISLLPAARGQGLGSRLLGELIGEARVHGRRVTICVEIHNPARRLYERLGFLPDGEPEGLYQRMAWWPVTVREPANEEC